MIDVVVIGAGPAGRSGGRSRCGPGRAHGAGHSRRVWRHGGQRRTRSGADAGPCGAADPRSATARTIWHCGERAGAGLSSAARARPRGRQGCACPFDLARANRFAGRVRLRTRRRRALRRPAHDRNGRPGCGCRRKRFILCTGGISRRLDVPGFEFTNTHSDAWSLTSVPPSMLVIGGGATGVQVASVFNAFGSRVQLFHRGPRILPTEDEDISAAVARRSAERGSLCRRTSARSNRSRRRRRGVRMNYCQGRRSEQRRSVARGRGCRLAGEHGRAEPRGGGRRDRSSGFVRVDPYLRTSARTFSPPAILPVACCWSRRRFRTASWRRPTRCAARR